MRLLELLIKGAGHKYIKRIPVGTTKSGKVRYRYIYNTTTTVGGKNLLDAAHLKTGTKLMLHSKDGAEVHAHIESVKGDRVTFTYDDGDRKGETRTVSKQKLLAEFNKENKVGEQIESAKAGLLADIKAAADKGTSEKQLAKLVARLESLGGRVAPDKPKKESRKEKKARKKRESAKADAPKADAPKADAPKADAPKADAPKADTEDLTRVKRGDVIKYKNQDYRVRIRTTTDEGRKLRLVLAPLAGGKNVFITIPRAGVSGQGTPKVTASTRAND